MKTITRLVNSSLRRYKPIHVCGKCQTHYTGDPANHRCH